MGKIIVKRDTINKKDIHMEPLSKSKVLFVRLPSPILERLDHQKDRLQVNMNILSRMALIKFLEEEEMKERQLQQLTA